MPQINKEKLILSTWNWLDLENNWDLDRLCSRTDTEKTSCVQKRLDYVFKI